MRLLPSRRVSGRVWWTLFALLIAVPALALAALGLRAVRGDRVEADQQLRLQQQRVAELADAAIETVLGQIATELSRLTGRRPAQNAMLPADAPIMVFDRSGLVTFQRDRLYFGPFGRVPVERAALTDWPPTLSKSIEEAQALEIQRRPADAIAVFDRIGRSEPRLQTWSAIAAARIRSQTEPAAVRQLARQEWAQSGGVTPSGLPAAFIACAASEGLAPVQRAAFAPLITATLEGVRSGRWWLSADERRFYDRHLRALQQQSGAAAAGEDPRLAELSEIERLVRQFPPARRDRATQAIERGASAAYLMVWTPIESDADAWIGTAVSQRRIESIVGPPLRRLVEGQTFGAAVRANGTTLWSHGVAAPVALSLPLRSLGGLDLTFTPTADHGAFGRREWLWYGFVSLLLVMLLAGVGMTAHVVRREMELANMQTEFVAAVTHEFKSPITSIRLLLERLSGGRLSAERPPAQYYAAIERETDRLERLVNRVLEAQQIEAGQRRYAFTPESLEELTEDVVRQLQPIAEAQNIRLSLQTDGDVPAVPMDRGAIADAIQNLVENAIKYSRGGTRVQVTLRARGECVEVDVADQGIGIERDELPRVFDKFYRARRGDLQNVRGTGLGLALVKAAAEAHGGTIEVESQPGVGSTFSLRLPA